MLQYVRHHLNKIGLVTPVTESRPLLTRFAPSPTGYLHVGNIRMALINWLFAHHNGGKFLLRMDDTDPERSEKKYASAIEKDLNWLGLNWDVFARQSDRFDRYNKAIEHLKNTGRLYPCYETPEELTFKRKRLLAQGKPPIYDRAALKLSDQEKQDFENQGRTAHWRLLLEAKTIHWEDLVCGSMTFEGKNLTDPVLVKTDGQPIYTLATIVDDMELGVTHIIRGEDHLTNTAIQLQLIEALGGNPDAFTFAHLPLLTRMNGNPISKRDQTSKHGQSLNICDLREEGIAAMPLNSLLAKLGTSDPIELYQDMTKLIDTFDIHKFARSTQKFDEETLFSLNAKLLHHMPFEKAASLINEPSLTQEFWEVIRGNLDNLEEIKIWQKVCFDNMTPVVNPEDADYIKQAFNQLPKAPWDENTWKTWTQELKKETGRKGRALFLPLRQAITGHDHGPEMKDLLPIIGYERTKERLQIGIDA